MKKSKKLLVFVLSIVILLSILFIPIPKTVELDGGTVKTCTALTYRIAKWNMYEDSEKPFIKTEFMLLPENFKDIEKIWYDEKYIELRDKGYGSVSGQYIVIEKDENSIIVDSLSVTSAQTGNHILISKETFNKFGSDITFDEVDVNTPLIFITDGIILYSYPSTFGKIYKIMPMEIG